MNFPETIEGCLLNVKSTGNWEWYDKEEINIWKAKMIRYIKRVEIYECKTWSLISWSIKYIIFI